MTLAVTEDEVRTLLEEFELARHYGFRLHALGEGECTIEAPFLPLFERPGARVAGPVFMAAADVAMWVALMTRLGKDDGAVTTDLSTKFLGAARRETFRARAEILKLGARLVYGMVECRSLDDRLLTHHAVTYMRLDPSGA